LTGIAGGVGCRTSVKELFWGGFLKLKHTKKADRPSNGGEGTRGGVQGEEDWSACKKVTASVVHNV